MLLGKVFVRRCHGYSDSNGHRAYAKKKCNVPLDLRWCLLLEPLHIFKDQGSKGKVNSSPFALNVDGTMKKEK
jgi:hypothetical protein